MGCGVTVTARWRYLVAVMGFMWLLWVYYGSYWKVAMYTPVHSGQPHTSHSCHKIAIDVPLCFPKIALCGCCGTSLFMWMMWTRHYPLKPRGKTFGRLRINMIVTAYLSIKHGYCEHYRSQEVVSWQPMSAIFKGRSAWKVPIQAWSRWSRGQIFYTRNTV